MNGKTLKKALSALASPFVLGIVVTAIIASAARTFYVNYGQPSGDEIVARSVELLSLLHEKTIDLRLQDRGPKPGSPDVAILAIDERAIEHEGRWPWPRDKTARAIDRAIDLGAKLIAFDAVFSEPDPNSSAPTIARVQNELAKRKRLDPQTSELLASEISKANSDGAFAAIVKKRQDQLVMGTYFDAYRPTRRLTHVDACIETLFRNGSASDYWDKEKIRLEVVDPSPLVLPPTLRTHLSDILLQTQIDATEHWLKGEGRKASLLKPFLAVGLELPDQSLAGAAQLVMTGRGQKLIDLLAQSDPSFQNPEKSTALLASLRSAFTQREQAQLQAVIQDEAESYCATLFTKDDLNLKPDANEEWSWNSAWKKAREENPELKPETLQAWLDTVIAKASRNAVDPTGRFWLNIPAIADATTHTGYFNATLDSDGSIRRSMLVAHQGETYLPSLAFKAFLALRNYSARLELEDAAPRSHVGVREKQVRKLTVLDSAKKPVMDVPIDGHGRLAINYAGARTMFPHVSAADILGDSPEMTIEQAIYSPSLRIWETRSVKVNKAEFLKGKSLIFGATAIGIFDLRVTPFEENFPGVETHANVLSNLLVAEQIARGAAPEGALGFLKTDPREPLWMIIAIIVIGLGLSALLSWLGSLAGLAVTAGALLCVYGLDKFLIFKSGTIIAVMFPIIAITSVFVVLTFYKYFTEERTKRELKGTFEKYVSPSIVAEVLADPSNIELGGKKMELTVMFSDVRGFTNISEKLDPRALSDLLNKYLTPMTALVFENKGTLDKYMGDAIMAFWGAPIHFNDHAKHACRCALQMIVKLKELQADFVSKDLPPIDIGIGLNTGEMSVGNMGSDTVRSYTVMGDAVNLGSRLEGINKDYGTRIIVSEFTKNAVGDAFIVREVDWVRVKGKQEPVKIFELVAEKGKTGQVDSDFIACFDEGFRLYHERNFEAALAEFRKALVSRPDDVSAQIYVERCEDYIAEPPPADWDGVVTKKTK